jgi:tetratricopeptide (TPR) repeat protein
MNRLLFAVCLAVAIAPGAFVSIAHADDPAERAAKRHYDRGRRLFDLQKFQEALEQFQKAYDAKPIPDFLFNIGQCQRNLGELDAAVFSFKKFLKLDPETPLRDKVERTIEELERAIEKQNSAKLGLDPKPRPDPIERPPGSTPVYKKWWFWTGIAVVGVGAGVGIYAASSGSNVPSTDLGHAVFPK